MTIDPMAAVTAATDGMASPAAGAVPSTTGGSAAVSHESMRAEAATDGAKADLFDQAVGRQAKPPALETLQPEGEAKYLSNPAALGEQVLQRMESLHQRSMDYHNRIHQDGASSPASPAGGGEGVMGGPAAQHVAGAANPGAGKGFGELALMFDYALETTMISSSSSQFVSSVNTLMRGQ
jgi:hypothetical protein